MKQKRYGEKAIRQALAEGYKVQFNEFFTLYSGYKVINEEGEIVGFITFDLWLKLLNDGTIIMVKRYYESEVYALAQ